MTEVVKRCPDCGGELVVRINRENGSEFLSCRNWRGPSEGCQHTEKVPESYRMRRMGHPTLPGLG